MKDEKVNRKRNGKTSALLTTHYEEEEEEENGENERVVVVKGLPPGEQLVDARSHYFCRSPRRTRSSICEDTQTCNTA